MKQIRLGSILLNDDLTARLTEKQQTYNQNHPDEPLTIQQTAELMLEYAVRYLDITAID